MNVYLKNEAIALIALSIFFSSFSPAVLAGSSTQLGSTYESYGRLVQNEIDADNNTARLIANYSAIAGFSTFNWYGAQTTRQNVYNAASGAGDNYSMAFYIGESGYQDWGIPWIHTERHWIISADDGSLVSDRDIFENSGIGQNVKFAFLWACRQGDVIGGTYYWTGVYGMPFVWLKNSSLSDDGYFWPDDGGLAFLGHAGDAPYLTNINFPGTAQFLERFYYLALCRGLDYSIGNALDYASNVVWAVPGFADTGLYKGWWYTNWIGGQLVNYTGQMKVYGDGNMHLSSAGPGVALKTKTSGCPWLFYVPNSTVIKTNFLKVEMLFDNANLTGDQTGNPSPYPEITHYPDANVDGSDLIFVASKFGSYEGETSPIVWDYMADVVPDKVIDGNDLMAIARNFGKNGTYFAPVTDQSGVSVIFNTGPPESPDANGFVPIPAGATNFNVTRNGTLIGAMIVFWRS